MKLEKCKQKVKKVGFLRVVIRTERIKMEEEKIKIVLDWSTPKYQNWKQQTWFYFELR